MMLLCPPHGVVLTPREARRLDLTSWSRLILQLWTRTSNLNLVLSHVLLLAEGEPLISTELMTRLFWRAPGVLTLHLEGLLRAAPVFLFLCVLQLCAGSVGRWRDEGWRRGLSPRTRALISKFVLPER